MKPYNIKILSIVLFGLFLLTSGCNLPDKQRIDVMSFNIRYDNPKDGIFSWDHRKDMVYWTIKTYKPDVLGLQEVLKGQLDELEDALTDYNWVGSGRDDGQEKGEYVPIFYRKDRFAKADEGAFWLSEEPEVPGSMGWDAACTRMVSWVKLIDINSGYSFYFFNTHFDHMGEEARKKSALLLNDSVRRIASLKPVIITGDFNCAADSEAYEIIRRLFDDAREEALKNVEPLPTTYLGFPANLEEENIIDHIFLSPHFGTKEYEIAAENTGGYFPSDHLPIWASLELRMP